MYIPKSVIVGLLFATIGLVGGWMLHGSANEVAGARAPATVLQDVPAAAGPPVPTGAIPGTTTSIAAGPGAAPGTSGQAISGDSSTVNTRTHIERTADGKLIGVSEVLTPGIPAVPAVPTVQAAPAGPLPTTTGAPQPPTPGPAPAPSPAYAPPAPTPVPTYAPPPPPAAAPSPVGPVVPTQPLAPSSPITITSANSSQAATGQGLALQIPPFFGEDLFKPLPTTKSRGVAFSEWESYRSEATGRNIMITTDDSNVFRDRNGKINGNTGDTDASGLNVTDAADSVIRGTESADEPPYQTVTQGVVDIATANPTDLQDLTNSSEDDGDANAPDPGANGPVGSLATSGLDALGDTNTGDPVTPGTTPTTSLTGTTAVSGIPDGLDAKEAASKRPAAKTQSPAASAAVVSTHNATPPNPPSAAAETDASGGSDGSNDGYDFPYVTWTNAINSGVASAVHTDEGTTLASGQEAVVIGADGYDDDDNRAVGENIMITRDDDNVVLGGTGDVNAQIGDSEQGAVIMGVTRTFIQGGGAY
jgi:hypothetical protein